MGSRSNSATSSNEDISFLDGGAIAESFNFGNNALQYSDTGLSRLLDFGNDLIEDSSQKFAGTLESINSANANSNLASSADTNDTIKTVAKYAAIAAVVYAGIIAYRRFK